LNAGRARVIVASVQDTPWNAPPSFIDVGSIRLAYWRFGRGPDLVFIHGWPLHAATFRRLAPLLSDAFTCHLIDLPGAGRTVCGADARADLVSHAQTVQAAVVALKLRRYGLLAQDSGATIARILAANDPRAAALVLGDTEIPGHHPALISVLVRMARLPGGAGLLALAMRCRMVRRSALGFGGCFADPRHIEGEFHDLFTAPLLRSGAVRRERFALLRAFDPALVDGLPAVHERVTAPTLLIWGEADPIFPLAKARGMVGQFGGSARLEVIPGGKAFVHEEHAEEFAAHARPFLLGALGRSEPSG
jgi:haloalkane dehalogenase